MPKSGNILSDVGWWTPPKGRTTSGGWYPTDPIYPISYPKSAPFGLIWPLLGHPEGLDLRSDLAISLFRPLWRVHLTPILGPRYGHLLDLLLIGW